jgi:hypothetical protein
MVTTADANKQHLPEYVIDKVDPIAAQSITSKIDELGILRLRTRDENFEKAIYRFAA